METEESVQAPEVSKRPLRKYLKRGAIFLVLLAVVLRAAVPLALPSILDKIAGEQGLQVSYSKLDLSLFAGSLELWDVSVRPLEEAQEVEVPELGRLEFLTLDVDVSALIGGTLRAHRVEIDGLDVYAKRESVGAGWGWKAMLPEGGPVEASGAAAMTAADDDPSDPDTSPRPFDWSLGFEASAIRLQHVQLHVEDHAMQPAFSADIELNVRLSHLGLADRPARLEVFAHSLELLDGLAVNGNLIANGPDLELACQVEMRGMRLRALEPYLTPLGITPIASRIDCGLGLELSTKSANEHATALEVQALASDVHWIADGQELMALDEITLQVPNFSRVSLSAETARIRGVRGRVHRLADGAFAIAGFGLHGTGKSSKPQVNGVEQAETSPDSGASQFEFSIPKLELSELALHWHDETLVPNPSLDLELQSMTVGPLVHAAGMASEPIHIEVHGAAPGVLETMDLVGDVQAFAETQSVELQLSMAGLKPDRIAPYLHAAGLSSDLQAGSGSLQISAQTHLDSEGVRHLQASLNDVQLQDGETLFALRSVALKGMRLHGVQASTRIDELSVDGTRLKVRRDPDGVWHCLGIALGADTDLVRDVSEAGASQESAVVEAAPAPQAPGPVAPAPVALFELGRLAFTGTQIEILDESLEPKVHQVLDDLGLVVTGLSLGGDASREQPAPAEIELWFRAAGLAERLALQGTLQSKPGPLDVSADLQVVGQGLELTAAEPWLQPLGIESLWNDARLGMTIKTGARKVGADTRVDLQLTDLAFENQGQSWLSMGALRIPSVLISKEAISMEPIEIEAPTLLLRRASQGEMEALALRFHPVQEEGEAASSEASAPKGAEAEGGGGLDLNLAGLQVHGVQVHWQDEAVEPAVDTSLRMEVGVQDLVLGRPASGPATWFAQLGVDGSLEKLRVGGEVWLDPADLRSHTQVSMAGLRPGALAAYLPANMAMELQDGRLDWSVQANYTARSEGGHGLSVEAQDLVFREGEAGPKLLSLPRLALNVPILDPGGHRFDIQELSLKGLELPVRVDESGRLFGLGFSLDPGVESAVAEVEAEAPAPVVDDNIHAGGTDQVIVSKAEDRILPLVTLDGLDVGIERFSFVDERGGTPFDFRLHLIQEGPMTLLAPEAIDLPPLKFKVEGAANPVVDSIELDLELAPYAAEPSFDLQALIAGVHGDQVTRVLPALADTLDGSAWTDGQLRAHVQGQLQLLRRGPLDFDLAQGFGLELAVDHVGVRATAEGPDLLGFEELTASVQSIRPDTGNVHVNRVEWVQPHGAAWKDEEGLHLAGWVLKMPQPVEQEGVAVVADDAADDAAVSEAEALVEADPEGVAPSDLEPEDGTHAGPPAEAAVEAPTEAPTEAVAEAPTEASVEPGPEIRIDEALISGGTFLFEDRTVEPVLVFPIDDVDFQAKRFSTRTLEEERPFDFRLALYGAGIELPERTGSGNLIGGILGSVAALAGSDGVEMEQRPVFDELTLRGKMSLGPLPKGWLQMRLRGFELPAIRGMAAQAGVGIGDGLMGESALLHMDGKGGLRISSHTHFSYLSLSEPLGGPISSFLKLPAPLDTVLFVLKDEDGDYSIPLYLSLDEGGASVSTIVAAITESFGLLIGDALASAPMRIVKGVVDLAGMGAEPIELTGDEWVDVPFGAGVVQAPGGMPEQVAPLLEMLRRDATLFLTVEHALGKDDVAQAWVLANPSRSECLELAAFYRGRRSDLLRDRDDAAAEVRVAYALGQSEQARSRTAVLKGLDAELGQAEAALDRVLERTRDQSERAQLRRTKTAALQVSRRRLARIEAFLRSTKVSSIGTRINARRPRFSKSQAKSQGFIRISVERRR